MRQDRIIDQVEELFYNNVEIVISLLESAVEERDFDTLEHATRNLNRAIVATREHLQSGRKKLE